MHEKAELNASKCWVTNGEGVVSDRQRVLNAMKRVGKFAKNAGQKTHKGNNLAKLNDAKCTI